MICTLIYQPFALLAKAALVSDARKRFRNVVVENGHGTVVLRGSLPHAELASEARRLAVKATGGATVVNQIRVAS